MMGCWCQDLSKDLSSDAKENINNIQPVITADEKIETAYTG